MPSPLASRPRAWIGISGYNYRGWRGRFYPESLRQRDWLRYASRCFDSIELNGTFYSLKSPDVYRRWVAETPDSNFLFAVKGSRFITHNLKLRNAEQALANFYASGVLALGHKTGPFLWQLPGTYRFDRARIESFLRLLPRDSVDAGRLAERHDDRLTRGALTIPAARVPYRHALEVRNPSYFEPAFYDLLRAYDVAFVVADTAGKFPYAEEITADFVYVRLHGSTVLYASGYTHEELSWWAERITRWARPGGTTERDVYVYFDNDGSAHAPHDAQGLAQAVRARGLDVPHPGDADDYADPMGRVAHPAETSEPAPPTAADRDIGVTPRGRE
ncbi:MAG TPA: DUF72 domain-containing protein [Solirubrobacteraceae bacterium]|nr:DUF72 domain-containing protein [Solirubrobacteraceae bacterium]